MKKCLLATVAALTFTGGAAAATPIMWTPAHMAKALTALNYPASSQPIFTITCKGAATGRKGAFPAFRCTVTYIGHTTARVYAKPLAQGRVCGSTTSLAGCRPLQAGPLAGDPNVCGDGRNDSACPLENAKTAALAHWKEQTGYSQPAPTCTGSGLSYQCRMGDGKVYTVTFTKGVSSWTTTVTP